MSDIALEADLGDIDHEADRFKRVVAMAVASVAFAGSLVGLLHSYRSNRENEAARDAAQLAVEQMADQAEVDALTVGDSQVVGELGRLQALRVLSDARRLEALPGSAADLAADAARRRFGTLADTLAGYAAAPDLPTLSLASQAGSAEVFRDQYEQELAAQDANDNGSIADACVAVLAVLAMALFLLGISLTASGRGRIVLAAPGIAIAVVACGWAVHLALRQPTAVDDELVTDTAEARSLVLTDRLDDALDTLDQVLRADPDYGRALAVRAFARTVAVASDAADPGANLHYVDDDDLDDALADAEAAQAHGLGDDLVNAAILGFLHLNAGDADAAVEDFDRLLARDPGDAFSLSAAGAARLMAGDDRGARTTYDDAIAAARRLIDTGQVRAASFLFAAIYTDSERVLAERPDAEDVVDDVRSQIVGLLPRFAALDEQAGDAPTAALDGDLLASNFGAQLFVSGRLDDAPEGTIVTSVWLHQRPGQEDAPFDVPTGSINGSMMTFSSVAADGSFEHRINHPLGSLGRCPVPGPYRVDVYAGRDLVGSTTLDIPETSLGDLVFDDNDVTRVGVCRPSDWTVAAGDNEVRFDDPDTDDSIEVRAFASTEDQRDAPDQDEVVAEVLVDDLEAAGVEPAAPPSAGFPLLGLASDGRLVCVAASAAAGSPEGGGIRSVVLTLGPDGVFREVTFALEDASDLQQTATAIAQSIVLEDVGDVPAGHEFDACNE